MLVWYGILNQKSHIKFRSENFQDENLMTDPEPKFRDSRYIFSISEFPETEPASESKSCRLKLKSSEPALKIQIEIGDKVTVNQ